MPPVIAFILHACVRDNHIPKLRRLSSQCTVQEPEHEHPKYGSPLRVAVWCDNVAAIQVLLDAGADPTASKPGEVEPTSAFHLAIRGGKRDILHCLWHHTNPGVDAAKKHPYVSFLHEAASYGQAAIVDDLLDWCHWSSTAKTLALGNVATRREVHVVRTLLGRVDYSQETIEYTPSYAIGLKPSLYHGGLEANYNAADYLGQEQLVALLIHAGANPNSKPRGENLVIKAALIIDLAGGLKGLVENGADPNGTGKGEKTALHHLGSPVQAGPSHQQQMRLHETGVRLLIDHGASVTQRDSISNTPLHYAAFGSDMRTFALYADSLADQDQDVALAALENKNRETLLHWAAGGGQVDIVRHLLHCGLDVNSTTANGWTPLMCSLVPSTAPMKQAHQVVWTATLLLAHGADPLRCTAEGWTALHCLSLHLESDAMSSMAQLAEDLISRGAPLQARAPMLLRRSTRSRSPSHGHGFGSRVQDAMQLAASAPDMVRYSETPLHWAAYHGAVGVASSLLAHGADVFAEDDGGNTPARLAAESPLLARDLDTRNELLQLFRGAECSVQGALHYENFKYSFVFRWRHN